MMYQHLEQLVGIRDAHLDQGRGDPKSVTQSSISGQAFKSQRPTPIRLAIALLLDHPQLAEVTKAVDDSWRNWDTTGTKLLAQLLETIQSQPNLNKAALLERWRDSEHFAHLNKLAKYTFDLPEMDQETELRDALVKLNSQYHKENRPLPGNLKPSELTESELEALKRRYPGTTENDDTPSE